MMLNIRLAADSDMQMSKLNKFFRKDLKIKYNRKLSRKIKLYVSEKNALKSIDNILTVYEHSLN